MTSSWDVFHSVRLEVERGVSTEVVRARLRDGALNGDDLIRPAGTTRWNRIAQVAALHAAEPAPAPEPPAPAPPEPPAPRPAPPRAPEPPAPVILPPVVTGAPPIRLVPLPEEAVDPAPALEFPPEDDEVTFDEDLDQATGEFQPPPLPEPAPPPTPVPVPTPSEVAASAPPPARVEVAAEFDSGGGYEPPILPDDEEGGPHPPELGDPLAPELEAEHDAEDDPASDFTLARNSTETVEELDLAAMVDVAFQLVLFFLVTASTVVFKTLEIPKPNEDKPPEAAAQSRAKPIDELEKDYILVEVDAEGAVRVDHLPVPAERAALVEKLRSARESTGRKAMLLSADFATRHKNAVLAFDVASEIDLQIAIAQPAGKN